MKKLHAQHDVSKRVFSAADANRSATTPDNSKITDRAARGYSNSLLRRPEVETRTGLSRSTIYDWMKRGKFPQPVKLGERLVAWREGDITQWLETRETREA